MEQNITQNITLVDWFSVTFKDISAEDLISYLGLSECSWESTFGTNGYAERLYFEHIKVSYAGSSDMGVWLEMSGQGCRAYETFGKLDWNDLIKFSLDYGHFTRLDIAFDDHTGLIPLDKVIFDTINQNYVSPMRYWETNRSAKGDSLVIGSPTSDTRIRIYDKARERDLEDNSHWIRIEFQLRNDNAKNFADGILASEIGYIFKGALHNYLRYVKPSDDSNKSRWEMRSYWKRVIEGVSKIRIFSKPKMEYNLSACERYVYSQAGNSIKALMLAYDNGSKDFVNQLLLNTSDTLPKKYKDMLNTYIHTKQQPVSLSDQELKQKALLVNTVLLANNLNS